MRTVWAGGTSRSVVRALLLLPLVAGVLAMHVLLLCATGGSGADPMESHAGHGSAATAAAEVAPVAPSLAVAGEPEPDHDGHATMAICLAVLVALVALALTAPRGRWYRLVGAITRDALERLPVPRPPPRGDLALLLCVSRT